LLVLTTVRRDDSLQHKKVAVFVQMPRPRRLWKRSQAVVPLLALGISSLLLLCAANTNTVGIISRVAGSATVETASGTSHELGQAEPLRSGATLTTALDSLVSVNVDQVGKVVLGPQTKTTATLQSGGLSFRLAGGSLCVVSQSQNVNVTTASLRIGLAAPATIYDVLADSSGAKVAVFRGGIVLGGAHIATTTIFAGSALTADSAGKISDVPIASLLGDLASLKCPDADVISQVVPVPSPSPSVSGGGHGGGGGLIAGILALAAIAAAAGHGGGGGGGGSSSPPPGAVSPNPSSLAFSNIGSPNAQSFSVSETGYSGTFTIDGSACAGVVSISPMTVTTGQAVAVTPLAVGGPCNLRITDNRAQSANVVVSVGPFGSVVPSPSSVSLTVGSPNGTITVSESGYSGMFTANGSACTGIATVSPASGTSFTVSRVATGNCPITFSDDHGQNARSLALVTSGTISINPQLLQLSPLASNNFLVSDLSPTTFAATSSDLTVATVTLIFTTPNAATFKVTAVNNGRATILVTETIGGSGGSGDVSVGVGQSPLAVKRHILIAPPRPAPIARVSLPLPRAPQSPVSVSGNSALVASSVSLVFTHPVTTQTLRVTEVGYAGPISATSSNPNIASVSAAVGVGEARTILVTAKAVGSTTIRISDDHGGQVLVTVTVMPELQIHAPRPLHQPQ
jgi:hypothetical protein